MQPIKNITGRALPIMIDDIDTDRIIPSRFLRCVTFEGIGEHVFYDERFDPAGRPKQFPMNLPQYKGASIIIAGKNFGCGSSREHAPQSIKRAGFQAVIAESFAEIFAGNSLVIGLVCVSMSQDDIAAIVHNVEAHPEAEISLSLEDGTVTLMGESFAFSIPDTARQAFINGSYDLLAELLKNAPLVKNVEKNLPY